ncbi:14052_t:CDS:2 [Funneliformis geosporum]|uniref:1420_t:CDS:1 n=1 Tax=Funneliformis geosporum TaxID=1117311 RepID=A0A9W4SI66_9GLOM|nr:14052_t:CDS:2 [Funneliformis geosporum]CAI2170660.1 1420_t:CDS:2 [Funneliformis geosporum]
MGKKKLANFPSKPRVKSNKKNPLKSKRPENPDKSSGKDIFEIDREEISKQERRRKNIDEIESYEYTGSENIVKEDDEEIDSDEAFDNSDEESDENKMDEEVKALLEEDNDVQEVNDEIKSDNLASFIGSLDKKRKRTVDEDIDKPKKQLKEHAEVFEESEYNLTTRESPNIKKKIDFQDLIGSIQEETGFSKLKQKLVSLESGGKKGTYQEPLPAPLPSRIQDKLNRQAAYEETKKDITKWEPIVKQNREAEHLKFPMNVPPSHKPTNNVLAATFQPSTELEKKIDSLLVESGVKEKSLQQYEELQMSKLSVEEVENRVKELRKMRELVFREEIKSKRIAKIKSKAYRKIRKKEKEKNKLDIKQLAELDPKLAREEQLILEATRAQERMTLRHKNTSKWAKQALKHGRHDLESRQAIVEQLQRHENLKRKIHDLETDEELSDFTSENSDDEKDDDINTIKEKAFDELAQLEQKEAACEGEMKGLFGMKFMHDAMERDKNRTRGIIDDFVEDLENENFDEENTKKDETIESKKSSIVHVGNNLGRMIFGAGSKKSTSEHEIKIKKLSKSTFEPNSSLKDTSEKSKVDSISSIPVESMKIDYSLETNSEEEVNPWLQNDSSKIILSSKKNNKGIVKENNKSDKIVSKLKKHKDKDKLQDGIEIDVSNVLTISSAQINGQDKKNKQKKKDINSLTEQDATNSDEKSKLKSTEDDSETFDETNFVHVKNPTAFSQRELVARAFANDNVVEEFVKEKQAIIEEDEPKEQDLTLPGWARVKKPKKKKLILAKPLPGGIEASKRKDAKLQHVIINEKRIKKTKKYLTTNIPHPFETREQYERSLRTPLGTEWNTQEVFHKMVTPRIITKMGTIIDPLNVPFQTNDLDDK